MVFSWAIICLAKNQKFCYFRKKESYCRPCWGESGAVKPQEAKAQFKRGALNGDRELSTPNWKRTRRWPLLPPLTPELLFLAFQKPAPGSPQVSPPSPENSPSLSSTSPVDNSPAGIPKRRTGEDTRAPLPSLACLCLREDFCTRRPAS